MTFPRPSKQTRHQFARQDGFTLIEVTVSVALAIVLLAIPLTLLIQSMYGHDIAASRSVAVRQGEVGLEQLTRDLRQSTATTISSSTGGASASATLTLPLHVATPSLTSLPGSVEVTWSCTGSPTTAGTCTRQVASGPAAPMIVGVTSACFDPSAANACSTAVSASNPSFVYLTIKARIVSQRQGNFQTGPAAALGNKPATPLGDVTLTDGVDLRNFS